MKTYSLFQMFADLIVSTESLARCKAFANSHTYSSTMAQYTLVEMKQAWASSKLFADRPLAMVTYSEVNFTETLFCFVCSLSYRSLIDWVLNNKCAYSENVRKGVK